MIFLENVWKNYKENLQTEFPPEGFSWRVHHQQFFSSEGGIYYGGNNMGGMVVRGSRSKLGGKMEGVNNVLVMDPGQIMGCVKKTTVR